ncbi:MAG: hypothetical protein KBF78_02320 [Fuscovulum sp.]|jgi:hypothetical protein|nr:hypothetical protein [Fuscovulum sp.]
MAFVQPGDGALDYFPCHYGASRLTFRGPRRDLTGEYLVALGGTETYGRFIIAPFPALVEENLGIPMANLGSQNAGPDLYLADRATLDVAAEAHLAVVQLTGAQNMTNRYYTVHPRRNDRFIAASPLLRSMYREVDFTEIHFTRHLVSVLASKGPDRFAPIAEELRALWVQRMKAVLSRLPQRRVLLWMADQAPPAAGQGAIEGPQPWLVDRGMIEALRPLASAVVEAVTSLTARAEGLGSMRFSPAEEAAAQGLPGSAAHHEAALALLPVIERLL